VPDKPSRSSSPLLHKFYQQYLLHEDSASFIKLVSRHYTVGTLERLVRNGSRVSRRAGVLSLGLIADYEVNTTLGQALNDEDRGVRVLTENALRSVWRRDGNAGQRRALSVIMRMNMGQHYFEAARRCTELLEDAPWFAEVWNQRAIAHYQLQKFAKSIEDCRQALERNAYHFGAAMGMAHCFLELNDARRALETLRRVIKLNPDLEGVRAQVEYLERNLEES